jgi:integrase
MTINRTATRTARSTTTKVDITTKAGRQRLEPRREPYWHKLAKRRYVGYRAGADTWIAKMNLNGERLHAALDEAHDFEQANEQAETWFAELVGGATPHYTFDAMLADYIDHRRIDKGERSAHEARQTLAKAAAKFKGREPSSLTTDELTKWRNSLLPKTSADDKRTDEEKDEAMRKAKDTANKVFAAFRAALQLAFNNGKIANDLAWRRIKPFAKVGKARDYYPTPEQVKALIDNCADDFRPLVRAGLVTGFRLGPLTSARVADFDPNDGTLKILHDKKHPRTAMLSSAACALFKQQAKDELPGAYLFTRADGNPWAKSQQHRPFRDACAKCDPPLPRAFIYYSLRHFFISRQLLAGANVHMLAMNVGTSPQMISKHYAKFIKSDVREMLDRAAVA